MIIQKQTIFATGLMVLLTALFVAGCCTPTITGLASPAIIAIGPTAASTGSCPNTLVTATFSEAMNPATINAATLTLSGPGTTAVTGTVTYATTGNIATFTPAALLLAGTTYLITVTTGAKDMYGNAMAANMTSSFTVAANGCNPPPVVTAVTPLAASTTTCPNAAVTVTFNEAMNPATVTAADFTLSPGVVGTVTHNTANTVFTLTPSANLSAGKTYTAQVSTAVQDTFGNFLPAAYIWSFTTATNGCNPPPVITAITPVAGATTVCPNSVITATFNEAMSPVTISAATFLLTGPGATAVTGIVTYNAAGDVAIFAPSVALALSTKYTATITTGVQDTFGNALANAYSWTFTTGPSSCLPPAPPISVTPANGTTGICNNTVVAATFGQAMNPATVNATTFTLTGPGLTPVTGVITANTANQVFSFTPTTALALSTLYTATLTTGVQDPFGNALATKYVWTFTTGATTCVAAPPTVVTVTPPGGSIGACSNGVVTATFSEAMNPLTINTTTFSLSPVTTGTVTMDSTNKIATFTPSTTLSQSQVYTATITTGAKDPNGVSLAANYVWTFTTGTQPCQADIPLGSAANFIIIAGSTITSTGATVVTGGNMALSPGSSITGFPPGVLITPGVMDITNAVAAQAQLDLTTAYNDAAGLANPAALPADLSGLTLTPGLYKAATSTMISTGNLTLNGQGNANAVFIFQIGSTLTTGTGTQIILTGGTQPQNIFWQVGSSATLGVGSTFDGTILAFTSISVDTNASVMGQLFARNGAVTLETNAVTGP